MNGRLRKAYSGSMKNGKRFFLPVAGVLLVLMHSALRAQDQTVSPVVPKPLPAVSATPSPAASSAAVPEGWAGGITTNPVCFNVMNQAPYSIFGTIRSDVYTTPEGVGARHTSNFRLKTGEGTSFCSTGPFYPERRLELVIRTLIPVFSCKARTDQDVIIYGRVKPEGGTETWAGCG